MNTKEKIFLSVSAALFLATVFMMGYRLGELRAENNHQVMEECE